MESTSELKSLGEEEQVEPQEQLEADSAEMVETSEDVEADHAESMAERSASVIDALIAHCVDVPVQ